MALLEHEVEIAVGRRATDGHVRVSLFTGELLALTVEGHSDRAPTLLLTIEQARSLQRALAELIPLAEESQTKEPEAITQPDDWDGAERRAGDGE